MSRLWRYPNPGDHQESRDPTDWRPRYLKERSERLTRTTDFATSSSSDAVTGGEGAPNDPNEHVSENTHRRPIIRRAHGRRGGAPAMLARASTLGDGARHFFTRLDQADQARSAAETAEAAAVEKPASQAHDAQRDAG
ncbi:MAG TPA: hypothetical protein VKQ36_01170 [Ktedonobacterales bacterium]|nr:hypothetical protein [Ktedonobacterales bacterium]